MADGIFKGMIVAGFVALVALLTMHFARAHDHEHPELNEWYHGLHAGDGGTGAWCCDGTDANHLADVDWESNGGHYRARVEGEWFDVPEDAVIQAPNRDGRAMVWMSEGYSGKSIRCFLPGALT